MKKLRAIIEKNEQCSTRFIYIAQSCTNERTIQGISLVDVKWNGLQNELSYIATEEKCLIEGTTAFLNFSDKNNDLDMQGYISKHGQKYVIKFQYHYYLMEFSTSEQDFTKIKNFLMRCFHVLVSHSNLNQNNKPFTFFLEGMKEQDKKLYPKITITLVNRYSNQLIPFLNKSQNYQVLKSLKQKQKAQKANEIEEYKVNPTSTSNNSVVDQAFLKEDEILIPQDQQLPPNEKKQLDSLAMQMQIEIKSHALKSILKLNETKLLQKQAAQQIMEIRPQSSNNLTKEKKGLRVRILQKKEKQLLYKLPQLNKTGIKIISHKIDNKNQWVFKVQRMKETSIHNQKELISSGYAMEVKQYKSLVLLMNQIDEE